jgi:CRISPR-associated protein Csm1
MNKRDVIVFAALLHDIGRFAKLAKIDIQNKSNNYNNKENDYLKSSYEFIEIYFPKILDKVGDLILNIHNPKTLEEKIVAIANIVAGANKVNECDKIDNIFLPIVSIFSEFKSNHNNKLLYFSPTELDLDKNCENLFTPLDEINNFSIDNYRNLWNRFIDDVKFADTYSIPTLLQLLLKYTWRIPYISHKDDKLIHDISLYDHLRLTSAFAISLYDSNLSEKDISEIFESIKTGHCNNKIDILKKDIFTIIGGDISGIQKFIYKITSKGAAKGLKGRSFYIELLNHIIVKYLIKELNIFDINIIYQGGGQFYIVTSGINKNIDDILNNVIIDIEKVLFDIYKERLGIIVSKYNYSIYHLLNTKKEGESNNKDYNTIWQGILKNIGLSKGKKYKNILINNHKLFFGPIDAGGKKILCEICGNVIGENKKSENIKDKCDYCESFEELGNDVIKNKIMLIRNIDKNHKSKKLYNRSFNHFGFNVDFTNSLGSITDKNNVSVYLLNNTNLEVVGNNHFESINFYFIGKEAPMDKEGNIKSFDQLLSLGKGLKRLGIMRADIDNLGYHFSRGFAKEKISFCRTAALSLNLKIFFEFYINNLIQNRFKNKIYLIYSGGDDLFTVGFWSDIIDFASIMNKKFNNFTKINNIKNSLTVSAGVAIFEEKYPLYKAAEIAGEMVEKSKIHKEGIKEKDSITFLGKTMFWNEFYEIEDIKNKLILLSDDNRKADYKSIYNRLLDIYNIYNEERERSIKENKYNEYEINWKRWRWMLKYILRNDSNNDKTKDIINEIVSRLLESKTESFLIRNFDVSIKWADYLTR